ncbi:IS3 family transposase [Sporomusa sp.]|uniref:IS3 family transposase n=1 Tax=Sporomusa sp. TaxID=2078658 RepID=UPI002C70E807|nr:IS3 family transposase [Sporomusa sp.]HWR08620.1 IS3 family transposase [Sporomusa sp.]
MNKLKNGCQLIAEEGTYYGYVKMTKALRRSPYQLVINKKKVYRLCKKLDILLPQCPLCQRPPRRIARNRVVTDSNQVWEMDIKYGYVTGEDRFFFILSIIDVLDRSIVAYHIGLSCVAADVSQTVKQALLKRQLYTSENKPVIRTDNGPQFISYPFAATCLEVKVEHERIPVRTPNKNAHIESYHAILEKECLSHQDFQTYTEAYEAVSQFVTRYNQVRIHSSIGYRPPQECYLLLQNRKMKVKSVRL